MQNILVVMVAVLLSFTSSAFAEEKPNSNYQGFYLGLAASGTSADGSWNLQHVWGKRRANPFAVGLGADGWQGGIVAGYNWDIGRPNAWIVGIEADFFAGGIGRTNALPYMKGKYVFDRGVDTMSISNQFTVRGRVGYDFNGFMPYMAAGGACASMATSSSHWMYKRHDESGTQCGPTVAIGTEMLFGKNNDWSGRIEYRQTDYGLMETEQTIISFVKHF